MIRRRCLARGNICACQRSLNVVRGWDNKCAPEWYRMTLVRPSMTSAFCSPRALLPRTHARPKDYSVQNPEFPHHSSPFILFFDFSARFFMTGTIHLIFLLSFPGRQRVCKRSLILIPPTSIIFVNREVTSHLYPSWQSFQIRAFQL
jgi:hypothetical protein